MALARVLVSFSCLTAALAAPVVISGATGRTGAHTYNLLKSHGVSVRAIVRNTTKAKEVLGCTKCDESEGIFVGDVTKPETLTGAMQGAGTLIILTSAFPICASYPSDCKYAKGGYPIDVDFNGGKNQVQAFVKGAGALKPVIMVSAGGTTKPDTDLDKMGNGQIGFYKLNMESFLMASGLPFTIVKPCGLGEGEPAKQKLEVGHDDTEPWDLAYQQLARSDLARVVAAVVEKPQATNLRFDLCSTNLGTPTPDADLPALLNSAKYPWQKVSMPIAV